MNEATKIILASWAATLVAGDLAGGGDRYFKDPSRRPNDPEIERGIIMKKANRILNTQKALDDAEALLKEAENRMEKGKS